MSKNIRIQGRLVAHSKLSVTSAILFVAIAICSIAVVPKLTAGSAASVVATVGVGSSPFGVGVNPNTNRIYVSNRSSNNVSVIDGSTNTVIATVGAGTIPFEVGVNPTTNRIYVANQ